MADAPVTNKIDIAAVAAAVAAVAAAVAADITIRLGFKVDPQVTDSSQRGESSYCTMDIEQNLGVFALVVKFAEVKLRMEPVSDGTIWVLGSLQYSHVGGGSNGSNIGTWWVRDGIVEKFKGS